MYTLFVVHMGLRCFTNKEYAGERVLNLQDPKDKELWDKIENNPDEIARAISQVEGKHRDEYGNEVSLKLEDIIVKGCSWNYGTKDKNPLSLVRFIDRDNLDGPTNETFVAREIDMLDFATSIPMRTQKNCIRVFCRDPAKRDLLAHKFKAWECAPQIDFNTPSGAEAQEERFDIGVHEDPDSNDGGEFGCLPVQLTQESCDEGSLMSPAKSVASSKSYQSPIPTFRM